ncbi:hypothetical protein KDX23_22805 [Burkholderia vietnamiensis]|uniref:hypothetical protein n=1 Tax=Burkholderia vietnamiensis TaxID=60552 RepID=UPI001B9967DE|nr:hypothetical protein [Burkholderia vietnamiensis]MBR8085569.1 hypothetical protein [Burkholderia vietnamiensis]
MSLATFEADEKRTATAQIFKSLAVEMLELAALDLSRTEPDPLDRTPSAAVRRADRHSALLWVGGKGDRGVVTFALCCDALNVPLEAMRDATLAAPGRVLAQIRSAANTESQHVEHDEAEQQASRRRALSCPM